MTAFFERGRVLVEAVRHGRMSDAEARAELAENLAGRGYLNQSLEEFATDTMHGTDL